MPTVSVIIPNYNHSRYLKQRIDSVLNQTYSDYEVIILDDHSTDNSKDIIERYRNNPKIAHIIYNPKNSGSTFKQWRKGVTLANGEYIWIAESDDWAEKSFLETLIPKFSVSEKINLVFSNSYIIDSENKIIGKGSQYITTSKFDWEEDLIITDKNDFAISICESIFIYNASAVIIKKKAIKDNTIDPSLRLTGDTKTFINLGLDGDIYYDSQCLNHFRKHINNVRTKSSSSGYDNLEFLKLFIYLFNKITDPDVKEIVFNKISYYFKLSWVKRSDIGITKAITALMIALYKTPQLATLVFKKIIND